MSPKRLTKVSGSCNRVRSEKSDCELHSETQTTKIELCSSAVLRKVLAERAEFLARQDHRGRYATTLSVIVRSLHGG